MWVLSTATKYRKQSNYIINKGLQKMKTMQLLLPVMALSVLALTSSGCTMSSSQVPPSPELEISNPLEGFSEKVKIK